MATVAEKDALVDAAVTAIASGDYATAENKLIAAAAILNHLPMEATSGGATVKYTAQYIADLLAIVQRKARESVNNAAGGIQMSRFRNCRVSDGC